MSQVEEVEEMVRVWNHEESTTSNENANIHWLKENNKI